MGDDFSFEDLLIIVYRRIFYFIIPAVFVLIAGVIAVMMLPTRYTATGTILIESQQIPTDLVRSTINTYARERIRTIQKRVERRDQLLEIADKYDIFPNSDGFSQGARVGMMKYAMNVGFVSADSRRIGSGDGTIAFTVSFTHGDPEKAYKVANEFMTIFMAEDVRSRTAGAASTTQFFAQEAERLRKAVSAIEQEISVYKAANSTSLPEHLDLHLSLLERATQEYNAKEADIAQLQQERNFYENQLLAGGSSSGATQELARLEAELARLRVDYHDDYPEVVAKRDEIAALKRSMAPSREIDRLRSELMRAEAAYDTALSTDPDNVSAINQAEAAVTAARSRLTAQIAQEARSRGQDPFSIQLESRLAVIDGRLSTLRRQAADHRREMEDYKDRIANTPEVERALAELTRDYDNIFREYQDLLAKQQDAQIAENLEVNQQAEKFSVLEPARRPDKPSSPDRPKFLVLVFFAACAAGGGVALGLEILMQTVRGRDHVSRVMKERPIAVIPYIHDARRKTPARAPRKRKGNFGGAVAEGA
ncbi:MAG: hypothetical protein AAGC77_09070 [Pseudomonadota bacterium]